VVELRGWSVEVVSRLGAGWLEQPGIVFHDLVDVHGREKLRAAGLLDDRGFVFNDHRLLFPFEDARGEIRYVRARRADAGEPRWRGPRHKWAPLFPLREVRRWKAGTVVYLTPEVGDCVVLLGRGHQAVTLVGFDGRAPEVLGPLTAFDLVALGGNDADGRLFNRGLLAACDAQGLSLRLQALPPEFGSWGDWLAATRK